MKAIEHVLFGVVDGQARGERRTMINPCDYDMEVNSVIDLLHEFAEPDFDEDGIRAVINRALECKPGFAAILAERCEHIDEHVAALRSMLDSIMQECGLSSTGHPIH